MKTARLERKGIIALGMGYYHEIKALHDGEELAAQPTRLALFDD